MFRAALALALLAISARATAAPNAPAAGAGVPITINTPTSVFECQPVQFTWTGGLAPYYLALIPGDQPFSPPLRRFPTQSGTSFTWNADLPAGTKFNLLLRDSTGAQAYSATVMEQEGNDKSCEKPITAVPLPGATVLPAVTGAAQNAAVGGASSLTSALAAHPTTTTSGAPPAASQTTKYMSASAARYRLRGLELWWVFGMGAVGVLML